ncbi:MAG TPA: hypothetical protein VFH21_00240 [Burkholderiales bacterium]|nr:hypothetical protein [Burkholderiales bacterium]
MKDLAYENTDFFDDELYEEDIDFMDLVQLPRDVNSVSLNDQQH